MANRNFNSIAALPRRASWRRFARMQLVDRDALRLIRAALMKRKSRSAVALFAACFALAASHAGADVFTPSFWDPNHRIPKPDMSDLRSLRFLTEDDYPPFHFALPDGSLAGFDVDLSRAICEELKIACTIQARRFDTLIDALDENQGDAIIASIRIDDQTRAKLDFTTPYYATPGRFVTLKTTELADATPESLRHKTVGVEAHSAHEAFLETFFPKVARKPYPSQKALREALTKGEIDALFGDGVSLSFWLQSPGAHDCCVFRGGPFIDSRFFGEGVGIAVKKGNAHLRQALDYALAALAAKGAYADLYLKYFPLGFY